MKNKTIEPGKLVRVSRADYHGIRFGAVCRVLEVESGDALVQGPLASEVEGWAPRQWVDLEHMKLAKQAMNKVGVQ